MASSPVFTALDQLGLRYERRQSGRGVSYAGFRDVRPSGQDTAVTLVAEHGVWRWTAHAIAPPEPSPAGRQAVIAGARLPLGAAYRSPEDGTLELSVAAWLGEPERTAAPDPTLVGQMLDYLVAAASALRGAPVPARPVLHHPPAAIAALRQDLESLGHAVEQDGAALTFRVEAPEGRRLTITVRECPDGWVESQADLLPPLTPGTDAAAQLTLQRLQRWAAAGRFVLGDGDALRVEVQTPNLGDPLSAARWSASQAAVMGFTAVRHLSARPTPRPAGS